jgi:anti-sigma factor RsiW
MSDPISEHWTDRLSEYLDDELEPEERQAAEAHLRRCATCGAVLADLKRVAARARALDDRPPEHDSWPAIAARIGAATGRTPVTRLVGRRPARRWTFSVPQLAAAAIALMTLSGGSVWLLQPALRPAVAAGGPASDGAIPVAAPTGAPVLTAATRNGRTAGQSYAGAVADLERVLEQGRGRLDPTTVRVLQRNLATIDSAIAQAQRAVAADSANVYLNSHLAETMQRKLDLLRQAAALVSSVS